MKSTSDSHEEIDAGSYEGNIQYTHTQSKPQKV